MLTKKNFLEAFNIGAAAANLYFTAALIDGVGGHAGVFSNANDVGILMQMNLQDGYYGGKRYFQAGTI